MYCVYELLRFRLVIQQVRTIHQPPHRVDDLLQKCVLPFLSRNRAAWRPRLFFPNILFYMKIRTTFSLKQLMLMVNAFWIMLSRRNWDGNYGGQKCIETAIWCPSDLPWRKYVCVSWVPIKDYKILFCWMRIICKECEFLLAWKRIQRIVGEVSGPQNYTTNK